MNKLETRHIDWNITYGRYVWTSHIYRYILKLYVKANTFDRQRRERRCYGVFSIKKSNFPWLILPIYICNSLVTDFRYSWHMVSVIFPWLLLRYSQIHLNLKGYAIWWWDHKRVDAKKKIRFSVFWTLSVKPIFHRAIYPRPEPR